jgi:hypothetical protein
MRPTEWRAHCRVADHVNQQDQRRDGPREQAGEEKPARESQPEEVAVACVVSEVGELRSGKANNRHGK